MCSPNEASDRKAFKELSQFECTSSSYNSHPRNRIPDPTKCVKKYRRSAAGGGVHIEEGEKRSLGDLEVSVDYLLGVIYAKQQSDGMEEQFSLVKTVNFVDDRLRAVQVDLTTSLGSMDEVHGYEWTIVRGIQVKLIRYNALTQYLLSNLGGGKYEWKFAHTALTTAISSYFESFNGNNGDTGYKGDLDEIMSYAALLHIATVVKMREMALPQTSTGQQCGLAADGGEGMSAILGLFRKYVKSTKGSKGDVPELVEENDMCRLQYPKYQWALQVASAVETGSLVLVLRLLNPKVHGNGSIDTEERWRIISRCCVAQVIPMLRIDLMRQYNKSFGKGEKVKDTDVSGFHMLQYSYCCAPLCNLIQTSLKYPSLHICSICQHQNQQ